MRQYAPCVIVDRVGQGHRTGSRLPGATLRSCAALCAATLKPVFAAERAQFRDQLLGIRNAALDLRERADVEQGVLFLLCLQ